MFAPMVDHWVAVEQILCYLKGASRRGILYSNHGHSKIECFTDADWVGSKEDRRSTSSYCVFVGGNLVSWKSKKQGVVSRSSAESEYRAMTQSVCEIMWLHQLLIEVGIETLVLAKLWCDSQAAFHIASNLVFHSEVYLIVFSSIAVKGSSSLPSRVIIMPNEYKEYIHRTQPTKSAFNSSVVQTGNASACLSHSSGPWILYFGAFDHIYGNKDFFSSLTITSPLPMITLANGSQTWLKESVR